MAPPKILDIGAELGIEADEGPKHIKTVRIAGAEFRLVCELNQMALGKLMGEGVSVSDAIEFMRSMVHEDDWVAFNRTLVTHSAFRGDEGAQKVFDLMNKMVEVVAERPTKQPSDLRSGGSSTSAGTRKSVASTSSRRVTASKRSR